VVSVIYISHLITNKKLLIIIFYVYRPITIENYSNVVNKLNIKQLYTIWWHKKDPRYYRNGLPINRYINSISGSQMAACDNIKVY